MSVHHEKVEEGCFVFQVVRSDRVSIKSYPDLDETEEDIDTVSAEAEEGSFEENELLAIDLIMPTSQATYLRLADQSGWVVAEEKGEVNMRQVPVESGLFSFYLDDSPPGMLVRRHPMDDTSDLICTEVENGFHLLPMQRIYCDAVTKHPITGVKFYRLQGGGHGAPATPGWVYDRKLSNVKNEPDQHMLLDATKVKTGLFAYKVVHSTMIRYHPNCSDLSKTSKVVLPGEIVVGDIVQESHYDNGNGPYLRLVDGSGWLFEKKRKQMAMEPVPIESGKWVFSVLNDPVGVKLRKHPVDCQEKVFDICYESGSMVECDRKISNGKGVNFYRVRGTTGWLFDQRNGVPMLNLLSAEEPDASDDYAEHLPAWEPNFIRGIAATVDGIVELSLQTNGQILTFDNADSIQVKVFCSSRTVCSIFEHSSKGTVKHFVRNCSPHDVQNIFRSGLIEAILAYDKFESERVFHEEKKEDVNQAEARRSLLTQQEETYRIGLLVCDAEIASAQAKRRDLLAAIMVFDNIRAKAALCMKKETERNRPQDHDDKEPSHKPMVKAASNKKYTSKRLVKSTTSNSLVDKSFRSSSFSAGTGSSLYSSSSSSSSSITLDKKVISGARGHGSVATRSAATGKRRYVCGECFRDFSGKYSRDLHCREVHKIFCENCDRIFPSFKNLELHKNKANHC